MKLTDSILAFCCYECLRVIFCKKQDDDDDDSQKHASVMMLFYILYKFYIITECEHK